MSIPAIISRCVMSGQAPTLVELVNTGNEQFMDLIRCVHLTGRVHEKHKPGASSVASVKLTIAEDHQYTRVYEARWHSEIDGSRALVLKIGVMLTFFYTPENVHNAVLAVNAITEG